MKTPKVLQNTKKRAEEDRASNWSKGTGGPYPWSKK